METKFYTGSYILGIGQPFVILSIEKQTDVFFSEKIIIFEAFDGKKEILAYRTRYPIISERFLDDFITSEIQVCKDDILHRIIYPKYHQQLSDLKFNFKIDLLVSNETILAFLRDRFPKELTTIETHTSNDLLRNMIKIYKSIIFEQLDFGKV